MNKTNELVAMPKGTPCEIQGEISYQLEPKKTMYGKGGYSQFIVVDDETGKIGVNLNLPSIQEGFTKGEKVHIKGKVDKYPDKKQPLLPNGTYPIRTSVVAEWFERYRDADDFTEGMKEITNETQPIVKAENFLYIQEGDYLVKKATKEELDKKMWENKDLRIVKQSALKAAVELCVNEKIKLQDLFKIADKFVDYVYNEDDKFAIVTEAQLIKSGLITLTKPQALAWLDKHIPEMPLTDDMSLTEYKDKPLDELLEIIERVALSI
jgi:hypothetical protein